MKKKIIVFMLVLVLSLGLFTACGNPSYNGKTHFEVSFNMNGIAMVTNAPDKKIIIKEGYVFKPTIDPTCAEKVFLGWYESATGEKAFDFDKEIVKDTVIYAHWRDYFTYTLTFDANNIDGATDLPAVQSVKENEYLQRPDKTPKVAGKIFYEWYEDSAYIKTFDFTKKLTKNTTAYARFVDSSEYLDAANTVEYNTFRGKNGLTDAKSPISADDITLKWEKQFSSGWMESMGWPIEIGDYLYFTSKQGGKPYLNKVSKDTGDKIKTADLAGATGFFSSIASGDGKIFVPLEKGIVQAFDADTMESLWISVIPYDKNGSDITNLQSLSAILYHDGYVYMGVSDSGANKGAFFCLSVDPQKDIITKNDQTRKDFTWIFNPKDKDSTAPAGFYWSVGAVVGNYIVFAGEDGVLYSHHLTEKTKGADNITVFKDSFVLKGKGETEAEQLAANEPVRCAVFYDAESQRTYVNTKAGGVHSIKVNTDGSFNDESYIKTHLASADITSSPTAYRGRLYIGGGGISSNAELYVMDANTLETIYKTDVKSQSSPMVTTAYATKENNYTVYIYTLKYVGSKADPDGLYIIKDWQGKTSYNKDTDCEFIASATPQYNSSSVMIDKDGTIFYKNDSGYLFAYASKSDNAFTANDLVNAIEILPEVNEFTLANENELRRAYYRYLTLTQDSQKNVINVHKLFNLVLKLEELSV